MPSVKRTQAKTMNEQAPNGPHARTEKRRGHRFPVVVPVEARWQDASGKSIQVTAQAKEVNAHGGLLEMRNYPSVGSQLELTNLLTKETYRARVVAPRRSRDGLALGVAVELLIPSETFWGVNFQLRKTSAELFRLEQEIRSGGIDTRILTDFRDAVDHVRKTAWAVQEWQERQLQDHDPRTVLPLLTTERIRRAAQLVDAIASDLVAHEVTRETPAVHDLFQAVGQVHQLLAALLKDSEA
jgi:hypothetical protein